jgi:hypothetical protein
MMLLEGVALADPCGFVPPPYINAVPLARTGVQRTYVFYKDGVETIAIRPGFTGKVEEFGMLVPLPSPPEIKKMPDEFFAHIQSAIDPPEVVIDLRPQMWNARSMQGLAPTAVAESSADKKLEFDEVRVLKQEAVGMYEVAVLEAGSASALYKWMVQHGFKYQKCMDEVTNDYVKIGWCFVAVKTRIGNKGATDPKPGMREKPDPTLPNGAPWDGYVQGMAYRFKVDKPVVGMRLSTYNDADDRRQIVYALTDEPIKIHGVPEDRIKRQIAGKKLHRNVTGLLPIRIVNGTVKELTAQHLENVKGLRDPAPHNGDAKTLFVSDLYAAKTGKLSLEDEELEKLYLRIGERMNMRGPSVDALHAKELEKMRKEIADKGLSDLKDMTLTVIDGEFPFELMRKENLTFDGYKMKSADNTNLKYDARAMGPNPQGSWGTRLEDPEAAIGIGGTSGKSWYEQLWGN